MSATAFCAIQGALVAALTQAPALAEGRVYVNRLRPIGAAIPSAIVVRLDQASAAGDVIGTLDWVTSYTVECYARAVSGADPAESVDALLSAVWARLSALTPPGLGVAAITLQPTIDWQYDDAETPVACALIRISVQHRTVFADLAPWA